MNTTSKANFSISSGAMFGIAILVILVVVSLMKDTIIEYLVLDSNEISESQKSASDIAQVILQLEKVTLDVSILRSNYFSSISTLPKYPTDSKTLLNFGKANPFIGGFSVNSASANTGNPNEVGALIYSGQRVVNNGVSQTSVNTDTRTQQRGTTTPAVIRTPRR